MIAKKENQRNLVLIIAFLVLFALIFGGLIFQQLKRPKSKAQQAALITQPQAEFCVPGYFTTALNVTPAPYNCIPSPAQAAGAAAAGDLLKETNVRLPGVQLYQSDAFSGNSTINYPIEVPAGQGGLAPNVSLTYSSGSVESMRHGNAYGWDHGYRDVDKYTLVGSIGNESEAGDIGLGWSLSGIGGVHRDTQTGLWSLSLNGSHYQLYEVKREPGAAGYVKATYRAKNDAFIKIVHERPMYTNSETECMDSSNVGYIVAEDEISTNNNYKVWERKEAATGGGVPGNCEIKYTSYKEFAKGTVKHRTTGNDTKPWFVWDKSGTQYKFGIDFSNNLSSPNNSWFVRLEHDGYVLWYYYPLTEIKDLHGNTIAFTYTTEYKGLGDGCTPTNPALILHNYPRKTRITAIKYNGDQTEINFITASDRQDYTGMLIGENSNCTQYIGSPNRISEIVVKNREQQVRKYVINALCVNGNPNTCLTRNAIPLDQNCSYDPSGQSHNCPEPVTLSKFLAVESIDLQDTVNQSFPIKSKFEYYTHKYNNNDTYWKWNPVCKDPQSGDPNDQSAGCDLLLKKASNVTADGTALASVDYTYNIKQSKSQTEGDHYFVFITDEDIFSALDPQHYDYYRSVTEKTVTYKNGTGQPEDSVKYTYLYDKSTRGDYSYLVTADKVDKYAPAINFNFKGHVGTTVTQHKKNSDAVESKTKYVYYLGQEYGDQTTGVKHSFFPFNGSPKQVIVMDPAGNVKSVSETKFKVYLPYASLPTQIYSNAAASSKPLIKNAGQPATEKPQNTNVEYCMVNKCFCDQNPQCQPWPQPTCSPEQGGECGCYGAGECDDGDPSRCNCPPIPTATPAPGWTTPPARDYQTYEAEYNQDWWGLRAKNNQPDYYYYFRQNDTMFSYASETQSCSFDGDDGIGSKSVSFSDRDAQRNDNNNPVQYGNMTTSKSYYVSRCTKASNPDGTIQLDLTGVRVNKLGYQYYKVFDRADKYVTSRPVFSQAFTCDNTSDGDTCNGKKRVAASASVYDNKTPSNFCPFVNDLDKNELNWTASFNTFPEDATQETTWTTGNWQTTHQKTLYDTYGHPTDSSVFNNYGQLPLTGDVFNCSNWSWRAPTNIRTTHTAYVNSVLGPYVRSVTNNKGQTITTYYDFEARSADEGKGNLGLPVRVVAPLDLNGATTTTVTIHDTFGRVTRACSPSEVPDVPGNTCPETYATVKYEYGFNINGAPFSIHVAKRDDANGGTTTASYMNSWSFYNGIGQVIQTQAEKTNDGQTITVVDTSYNGQGLVEKGSLPYEQNNGGTYKTPTWSSGNKQYTYDSLGRKFTETNPDTTTTSYTYSTALETYGPVVHRDYVVPPGIVYPTVNPQNRKFVASISKITNAKGQITTSYNDPLGRLVQTKDNMNNITTYYYDDRGLLTDIFDAKNQSSNPSEIKYSTYILYNLAGQKTDIYDPDLGHWKYEYDALGNLYQTTDARGVVSTSTYDELNRVISHNSTIPSITPPVAPIPEVTLTYDQCANGVGKLCRIYNRLLGEPITQTEYTYDTKGRKSTERQVYNYSQANINNETQKLTYHYDAMDRIKAVDLEYPDQNETTTYAYNAAGQLTNVTGDSPYLSSATYNDLGLPKEEKYGNNTSTTYQYNDTINPQDPANSLNYRLKQIAVAKTTNPTQDLLKIGYSYDLIGNILTQTYPLQDNRMITYEYDDLNRLTKATIPQATQFNSSYTYDSVGNIQTKKEGDENVILTYDTNPASGPVHAPRSVAVTAPPTPTPVKPTPTSTAKISFTVNKTVGKETDRCYSKKEENIIKFNINTSPLDQRVKRVWVKLVSAPEGVKLGWIARDNSVANKSVSTQTWTTNFDPECKNDSHPWVTTNYPSGTYKVQAVALTYDLGTIDSSDVIEIIK